MILPIFTSNFSISKSILTLDENPEQDGADSILEIAKSNNLKQVVLMESTFIGFKKETEAFDKAGVQLIFGIRFNICNNRLDEEKVRAESEHKVVVFAKNSNGCRQLMKLYSFVQTKSGGFLDYQLLKERFSDDLLVVVPFYDSFISQNSFWGKKCLPELSFCSPVMWVGEHGLPFDKVLRQKTLDFAAKNGYPTQEIHHIYYKSPEDISPMITYKILTNRQGGKAQTLDKPELAHFGSSEFCWTAFQDKYSTT